MAQTTETRRTLSGNKPLYAVAGAGDLAVAKLRELPERIGELRHDVAKLPSKAKATAQERLDEVGETYDDLVVRGRSVLRRIRGQRATEELVEQAQATVRQARRTRSTARRSASQTGSAARSTAQQARETVDAATQAGRRGANKVGS